MAEKNSAHPVHSWIRKFQLSRLILSLLFSLFISAPTLASYQDSEGRVWRALTATTGLAASQVDAICDDSSALCVGSLGGTDFTGWKWATLEEIRVLFTELTGFNFSSTGGILRTDSPWAPKAVVDFGDTDTSDGVDAIGESLAAGIVSTRTNDPMFFHSGLLRDIYSPRAMDIASVSPIVHMADDTSGMGFWLYRDAVSQIPEPGMFWIVSVGMLALFWVGRRR